MKRSKKKAAKRPSSLSVRKLLDLKYRINDAYRSDKSESESTKNDKSWVMEKVTDIRKHGFTKLAPEDGHCCNGLWKKYSPSRLNNWESSNG